MGKHTCTKCGQFLDIVDAIATGSFDVCRRCLPAKKVA